MSEPSVTKSVMETYTVSAHHEHATIAIRCWSRPVKRRDDSDDTYYCGEILINSSFGSWANIWTACGCPFKEFLIDAEFDYVFTKFMGAKLRIFDGERTVRSLRAKVIEARRSNELDSHQAREIWDRISECETEMETSDRDYCEAVWRIARDLDISEQRRHPLWGAFSEPYYSTEHKYDPSPVGFWRELWPHFVAELKREAKAAAGAQVGSPQQSQQGNEGGK